MENDKKFNFGKISVNTETTGKQPKKTPQLLFLLFNNIFIQLQ